MGLINCLFP